jgi:uncharacterized protein with HEPN domain
MAARSLRLRLDDILESIDITAKAVDGRDLASFDADPVLRLAIERAVEIISEAVRYIPEEERDKYPDVPWRNIMAIGNKLRHEYHRVDSDIVWDIATTHLAALRPVIKAIGPTSINGRSRLLLDVKLGGRLLCLGKRLVQWALS